MDEILGKRLRHRKILAPLQGAHESYRVNPGRYPGLSPAGAFSAGGYSMRLSKLKSRLIIHKSSFDNDAEELLLAYA